MNTQEENASFFFKQWLPTGLCALSSVSLAGIGLLNTLYHVLAYSNLRFGNDEHCVIFLVGWLTSLTCFVAAYRLIKHLEYRSLWWCLVAGALIKWDLWLCSLPGAKGLLH